MRLPCVMLAALIVCVAHADELPGLHVAVTNNAVASVTLADTASDGAATIGDHWLTGTTA